ncbi:MAG: protein-L-isoaspartate(D-aspartate) O-methyltransferase [Actinomycetes bacterium]
MAPSGTPPAPHLQRHLMEQLRATGQVTDPRVLDAVGAVPRSEFVPAEHRGAAYDDVALPIGHDQTISQPLVVAVMTQALELQPSDRVLEVGTGSGYQAAVLRQLVERVVTVERIPALAQEAADRLARLGLDGIEVHTGDGTLGWPDAAPYDAVVVTAGGPEVPAPLLDQLADGGRLVAPVGPRHAQELVRVRRSGDRTECEDLGPVAFVPLLGAAGWPAA